MFILFLIISFFVALSFSIIRANNLKVKLLKEEKALLEEHLKERQFLNQLLDKLK